MEVEQTDMEAPEIERSRWKSRRRMAGVALAANIATVASVLFFVDPVTAAAVDSLLEAFMWTNAAVIGAYMGFTAWTHKMSANRTFTTTSTSTVNRTEGGK